MRRQRQIGLVGTMMLALIALSTMTLAAETGGKEDKIARAMQAAPDFITREATITDTDGTLLRQGTNGWTCMPASPGGSHPMCNDEVWMRLVKAIGDKADFKTDKVGISYMLTGDDNINNADPYDTKPDPGEVWVQEGPHLMILVPDVKALEGLTDNPDIGGPYIMWKDTPYAHIMVPIAPRKK